MSATLAGLPTTLDHEWGGVTWQATPTAALIAAAYHVNGNNGAGNATDLFDRRFVQSVEAHAARHASRNGAEQQDGELRPEREQRRHDCVDR
ncbi:MAG: Outer membrane porin OmpC [uncultured Caballeronia sp.]|nr:MAG: Outer membrane porin OmpC [uncultured Caballeronia sp.]